MLFASYAQLKDSGDVDFTLYDPHAHTDSYVAVGLSQDKSMGDSSVMFCYTFKQLQDVGMSWNFKSTSVVLNKPKEGLTDYQVKYVDGTLSCSFRRRKNTNIDIPEYSTFKSFDLSQKYHLLLARGPVSELSLIHI